MKVVIHNTYGGFSLDEEAYKRLGIPWDRFGYAYNDKRTDENLIRVVEQMKSEGKLEELTVVEIPSDIKWFIEEFDGKEWVAEEHRTWGNSRE